MTFLFNSDAQRGAVFRSAFARELPHLPFANDPATVDSDLVRRVRIVRGYGKYDRREAPQYYADAKDGETLHA
jgi:hypothetical protein